MASKGQKFLNYTDSKKFEIIHRYKKGESGYQLSKEYGVPVGTIKMWKYKIDNK